MNTDYPEIWLVDFEFQSPDGERPAPICMVAREWHSGQMIRLWRDELLARRQPPFSTGPDALFLAYYASAELGCFLMLDWPMPRNVLDLCAEFKLLTSGLTVPCGRGLLGALAYFGLGGIEVVEKETMRTLAMRGGPFTECEKFALIDYCQTDVDAMAKLLPKILPSIDMPRALLRGRYMAAVSRIEANGTPIDMETLAALRTQWHAIQDRLIAAVDAEYGVFEGRTFKIDRWNDYLARHEIPWPHLESGSLDLSDETFREMARTHLAVAPIRELRHSLSQLRLNELAVGHDGRNRCMLSAFASRTGRNQPSNSKFIFGPAAWLRSLITPSDGMAVAYIDYEQQEFGIGAALACDEAMMQAYASGDPYLTFAKQAGAVPADATKQTHKTERERFKVCSLAVQYGMGEESLARKLGDTPARARQLLRLHRETYPDYWKWSDRIEITAMLAGELRATFGWMVHVGPDANPRSLRNFPLQGNGAEMLRLACIFATERGIRVCAPVHDALLVEGRADDIENVVAQTQQAMREASQIVLAGFSLRTDAKVIRHPDRYSDPRGEKMWAAVTRLLSPHAKPHQN